MSGNRYDEQATGWFPSGLVEAHAEFCKAANTDIPITVFKEEFWKDDAEIAHMDRVATAHERAFPDSEDKMSAFQEKMNKCAILKISELLDEKNHEECDRIMKNKEGRIDVVSSCTRNMPGCGNAIQYLAHIGHQSPAVKHMQLSTEAAQRIRSFWKKRYANKGLKHHNPDKFKKDFAKYMNGEADLDEDPDRPISSRSMPGLKNTAASNALPPLRVKPFKNVESSRGPAPLDILDDSIGETWDYDEPLDSEDAIAYYMSDEERRSYSSDGYPGSESESSSDEDPMQSSTQLPKDSYEKNFEGMPKLTTRTSVQKEMPSRRERQTEFSKPTLRQRDSREVPELKTRGKDMPGLGTPVGEEKTVEDSSCRTSIGWLEHFLQKRGKSIQSKNLVFFAISDSKVQPMMQAMERVGGAKNFNSDGIISKHLFVDASPREPLLAKAYTSAAGDQNNCVFVGPNGTIGSPKVEEPNNTELAPVQLHGISLRIVAQNTLLKFHQ